MTKKPSAPRETTGRPGRQARPPAKQDARRPEAPPQPGVAPTAPLPAAPQNRWQRTVRYGWDKGGSKGGRR